MKNAITIVLTLALMAIFGCESSSPRGGSVRKGEGFTIAVPTLSTEIKQGQAQNVVVSLERGDYFKQDVRLQNEDNHRSQRRSDQRCYQGERQT